MSYRDDIRRYEPMNAQEKQDKKVILDYIKTFPSNILTRENEFGHITSSGFIMNKNLDKVLMIHHNIMDNWAWTGGHADGEENLLEVAVKEAKEETGIKNVYPLSEDIASLDILYVEGHVKRGNYVSCHVHLSVAYILIADESEELFVKEDENSGVRWFDLNEITKDIFSDHDMYLYGKLIEKAKQMKKVL